VWRYMELLCGRPVLWSQAKPSELKRENGNHTSTSFPCLPLLHSLITCSMQYREGKPGRFGHVCDVRRRVDTQETVPNKESKGLEDGAFIRQCQYCFFKMLGTGCCALWTTVIGNCPQCVFCLPDICTRSISQVSFLCIFILQVIKDWHWSMKLAILHPCCYS